MARSRIAAINFDHMHMGDLLREVHEHDDAEIAGICDARPERMRDARAQFGIPADRVFTDVAACLAATRPDIVILCPATADHARAVEEVAASGADILIEKPFAASLADADRMIAATEAAGVRLAINWPLAWYPPHVTAKRLVDEGAIGEMLEVHHLWRQPRPALSPRRQGRGELRRGGASGKSPTRWWYKPRQAGGGSLLDYLGYGATLGTWYMNGERAARA